MSISSFLSKNSAILKMLNLVLENIQGDPGFSESGGGGCQDFARSDPKNHCSTVKKRSTTGVILKFFIDERKVERISVPYKLVFTIQDHKFVFFRSSRVFVCRKFPGKLINKIITK